jgi:protease-4
MASDVAWREMVLLQQTKPVVVSMGDMAASGGYYISAPADYIFADRLTLTGSIGVFGSLFNFEKLITNIAGVTIDSALTSPSAGGINLIKGLTEAQRASINKGVDKVYKTFTGHVAEGRNLPIEDVLKIAEGRIWSGSNALELGLVDAIGGFNEAILKAAELADVINDFELYEYTAPSTPFDQWIKSMGIVHASMWGLDFNIYGAEICDILSRVPFTITNNGIQAMLPGNVTKVF